MTISRMGRMFGAVAILAAVGVLPAKVLAAGPTIQKISFVSQPYPAPYFSAVCGFPVTAQDVVNINILTYPDGTIKVTPAGPNTHTLSTAYGTLTARFSGINVSTPNPDGTITFFGTGPGFFITVPGVGPAFGGTGMSLGVFDPNTGTFTLLRSAGPSFSNIAAICTYLGPPGYQFPG